MDQRFVRVVPASDHQGRVLLVANLAALNRRVHDPSRLAILTALSACEKADFVFLLNVTRLTKGNLSSHLSKLEQAGLVIIEQTFVDRRPITYAMLSLEGRDAPEEHWTRLDAIRKSGASLEATKIKELTPPGTSARTEAAPYAPRPTHAADPISRSADPISRSADAISRSPDRPISR